MNYLAFKRLTLSLVFSFLSMAVLLAITPTPTPAPKGRVKSTRATATATPTAQYKQNSVPFASPRRTPQVKYKQNSVPLATPTATATAPVGQEKKVNEGVTPTPTVTKQWETKKKSGGNQVQASQYKQLEAPGDKLKKLPDLVLVEITRAGMHIRNKGVAPSGPCQAKAICWGDSHHPTIKDAHELRFDVPALQPGSHVWIQTRCPKGWGAYVDWSSQVDESNEQNNEIDVGASFDTTKP